MKETYSRREIVHKAITVIRMYHQSYRLEESEFYANRSRVVKSFELASSLWLMDIISYDEYVLLE